MARPYNHLSNIGPNGQPLMSENAWDLREKALATESDNVSWGQDLARAIEASETRMLKMILSLLNKAEESYAKKDSVQLLANTVSNNANNDNQANLMILANAVTAHIAKSPSHGDLLHSINLLSNQVGLIKTAVLAQAEKIDIDFTAQNAAVTSSSLDVDYKARLQSVLI